MRFSDEVPLRLEVVEGFSPACAALKGASIFGHPCRSGSETCYCRASAWPCTICANLHTKYKSAPCHQPSRRDAALEEAETFLRNYSKKAGRCEGSVRLFSLGCGSLPRIRQRNRKTVKVS